MACCSPSTFQFKDNLVMNMMLLLLCLNVVSVSGFNIEERFPIIKTGPTGSLFGLSVAEHHINVRNTSKDNALLLVGAPTGVGYGNSDDTRSGALYRCSVLSDANCTRVPIDPPASRQVEDTTSQWLGVSVKSHKPGGPILTCAHRYTLVGPDWVAPVGRCFILEKDATPPEDLLSAEYVPCEYKQDEAGRYSHAGYGYCQAGASVNFADVSDGGNAFLLIGAPGSIHWSGAILATRQGGEFGLSVEKLWSEKNVAMKNFQMGSSVLAGFLYKHDVVNFVTGAPGANTTGAVYILEKSTPDSFDSDGDPYLGIVETVNGDKVASRFGHDILLLDVTGDGKLDLIVAAPQFYDRNDQVGGAVYVYVNKGLSTIGPSPSQRLFGKIDSYFGMAIANAGDINMDGVNDIAIGAPGENGWSGVVYLYHGDSSADSMGVSATPSQVIEASKVAALGGNTFGLGYSLSGGLDMDFNGYPDIAVGSLSDSAVIFFARPVVNITGTISGPNKKIELSEDPSEQVLDVKICLRYTALPPSFDERVRVVGYVELDAGRVERGLLSRLSFQGSSSKENVAKQEFAMTLYRQSSQRPKCQTWQTYMKNDIRDKLSPIDLKLTYTTPNDPPKRRRRRRDTTHSPPIPIMNAAITDAAVAEIEFAKRCGDDEICNSNLQKTAYYQVLKNGNWSDLKKERDGKPLLVLGTEEQIGMVIEVTNRDGEDAHQARMNIILPEEVTYRRIELMAGNAIHCDPDSNNQSLVVCHLGNPFNEESSVKFQLKMSKTQSIQKATQFAVTLQLLTTSQQKTPDPGTEYLVYVEVEAQLELIGYPDREQVNFAGKVIGDSAVIVPTDAGTLHMHKYEVKNSGTGIVEDVALKIMWPQTIKNGKWLFYLLDAEVQGFGNCSSPQNVNPLQLDYKSGRTKRDVNEPPGNYKEPENLVINYPLLSCEEGGGLTCIEVVCFLGDLAPKVTARVDLTAILWNSTFLEEYSNFAGVYVESAAKVSILQENIKFSKESVLQRSTTTTVLPLEIFVPEQPIEWWIIAVAGAAGIILLVFLVLIMWKCGFFKRQTLVDYQKARKHKQASKKAEEKESLY